MIAPLLLAILAATPPAPAGLDAAPAWCARMRREAVELRETAPTLQQVIALADRAPSASLRDAVRTHAVRVDNPDKALGAFILGLDDGCVGAAPADASRAEAQALLEANGLDAVRKGESITEYILRKLSGWIWSLLESEGMSRYAEVARTVFLGLLALLIAFLAWRLMRSRARTKVQRAAEREALRVERERVRAFAEWRAEADARLDEGDARGAWRAAQMALLARLGEVEPGAVKPARTSREILRSLDEARRSIADAPLSRFERAFYAGEADLGGARGYLREIDEAADALRGSA